MPTKLKGHIGRETAKAIQFTWEEDNGISDIQTKWIPISQVSKITRSSPDSIDNEDELIISDWIYEKLMMEIHDEED